MRPLRETTLRARALRRLACRAPCIAATARCPAQARGGGWLVLRDGVQRRQRGRRGGRSSHCSKPPPPRRPRRCRPYAPGRLCRVRVGKACGQFRVTIIRRFRNSASSALDFTKSAERSPMQVTFSGYFCWFQQKTDLFARIFLNMWETREGRKWCWSETLDQSHHQVRGCSQTAIRWRKVKVLASGPGRGARRRTDASAAR